MPQGELSFHYSEEGAATEIFIIRRISVMCVLMFPYVV